MTGVVMSLLLTTVNLRKGDADMKTILRIMNGFFVMLLLVSFANAAPSEWNIDPAHSGVYFDVRHIFATVRGQFDDYTGKFIFDPESNDTSSCEFEVKVKSINTNINQRDTHLRSEDFFAAKKFPTITFKSTRINQIEGNQFEIVGNLTVKDVTKEVKVPFTYFAVKDNPTKPNELVAGFEGKFNIDRLEYNVGNGNFYKMGLVGKDVLITISLEVLKKK
jgi:polyisoprenoid-binding protein YceI